MLVNQIGMTQLARGAKAGERRRNPRGQGSRLRAELLEAASEILTESHDPQQLSLRSVARKAGIAATSVYLHFADVNELTAALAERDFRQLGEAIARAYRRAGTDPGLALLAGCRAYCKYAIKNPGQYRVLFEIERPDLGPGRPYSLDESAGRGVLEALSGAIERCRQSGAATPEGDARVVAVAVWTALHGIVSLRLSRPRFPWPPLDPLIDLTVRRLVGMPDLREPQRQ
jgi:AcrR family transcriptional regulator